MTSTCIQPLPALPELSDAPSFAAGSASGSRTMPGGFPEAQHCIPRISCTPALSRGSSGCAFSYFTALLTKSRLLSQDSVNRILLPIMQIRCRFIPTDLASPTKERGTAASRWYQLCEGIPSQNHALTWLEGLPSLPHPLQSRARASLPSQTSNHPTSGSPLV